MLWTGVACLCLLTLSAALLWTMPAQTLSRFAPLPPRIVALEGSARDGRARLAGGTTLSWSLDPLLLLTARVGGTWRLGGAETRVAGTAALRPGGMTLGDVSGRFGPDLAASIVGAPCASRGSVDLRRLVLDRDRAVADGEVDVEGGPCVIAGRERDLPDTRVALTGAGDAILITATAASGTALASARITPGRRLLLRIEPAGAALAGLPSSAPIEVDTAF